MFFICLRDRDINVGEIEEIYWALSGEVLVGCHIYYKSGRGLDLGRIESNIVRNQMRAIRKDTDKHPTVVTGTLKR